MSSTIVVAGAGVYGVTAALELRERGHQVQLLDPGPLPHPLAESTDISKTIRLDYGPDDDYLALMGTALAGWRRWNAEWPEPLFHETGVLFLCRAPMQPGGFEYESFQRLLQRSPRPQRLTADDITRQFPAWEAGGYTDGYYNPVGGYARSGQVMTQLLAQAKTLGVELHEGQTFANLIETNGKVTGIITRAGSRFEGECVILALGAWTPYALPELADVFRSNGMPVFHLQPNQPEQFRAEIFPVFAADVTVTGYYGFPLHPMNGVVKIANHGPGRNLQPESANRNVTEAEILQLRAFLKANLPALAEALITYTRACFYCDTWDGHFWIARHPERAGLVVATGGSGHGFKFAPVLGGLIADAVEGQPNPYLRKFRWRPATRPARSEEAARHQE